MLFISFPCWKYEQFRSYRCFSFHWQKFCSSVNWCWQLAFRLAVPRSPWKKERVLWKFHIIFYVFFLSGIDPLLSLPSPPSLSSSFLWDEDFDFWNKAWGTLLMALNSLSSAEDNFELLIYWLPPPKCWDSRQKPLAHLWDGGIFKILFLCWSSWSQIHIKTVFLPQPSEYKCLYKLLYHILMDKYSK